MIKVLKHPASDGVYVGRTRSVGSLYRDALHELANPFSVKQYGRDGCIARYRKWLWQKIQDRDPSVLDALEKLKCIHGTGELNLVCHCAPLPCHADVIKACLEWMVA